MERVWLAWVLTEVLGRDVVAGKCQAFDGSRVCCSALVFGLFSVSKENEDDEEEDESNAEDHGTYSNEYISFVCGKSFSYG